MLYFESFLARFQLTCDHFLVHCCLLFSMSLIEVSCHLILCFVSSRTVMEFPFWTQIHLPSPKPGQPWRDLLKLENVKISVFQTSTPSRSDIIYLHQYIPGEIYRENSLSVAWYIFFSFQIFIQFNHNHNLDPRYKRFWTVLRSSQLIYKWNLTLSFLILSYLSSATRMIFRLWLMVL